jgi:ubiquinone biosynthesis accessory factor UbiJ
MAIASPLADMSARLSGLIGTLTLPDWLLHELQDKLVLLLNHVLGQEPAAMERLRRQQGQCVQLSWREYRLQWLITPAGLLARADTHTEADLHLHISQTSPLALVQGLLKGEKPAMRIDGDVMLAADINWLVDHVRWDMEEDLARVFGDATAHHMAAFFRRVATTLREFVAK